VITALVKMGIKRLPYCTCLPGFFIVHYLDIPLDCLPCNKTEF